MQSDHPPLEQGVAYVVWTEHSRRRLIPPDGLPPDAYDCSLQPFAGQELPVEEGPELTSLEEALAWARARTSAIVVRPAWDPGHNYYATAGPPDEWTRGL